MALVGPPAPRLTSDIEHLALEVAQARAMRIGIDYETPARRLSPESR
jgi:hypothetical protein